MEVMYWLAVYELKEMEWEADRTSLGVVDQGHPSVKEME